MVKNKPLLLKHIDVYFSIDEKTGKISRSDRRNANGSVDKDGYLILKIKGKQYKAHRIAYYMYHGVEPDGVIDHVDKNKINNSKDNIRDITQSENAYMVTHSKNKDTGLIGIHITKKTPGLKAIYTTRIKNKIHRFREISDAIKIRIINNLKS